MNRTRRILLGIAAVLVPVLWIVVRLLFEILPSDPASGESPWLFLVTFGLGWVWLGLAGTCLIALLLALWRNPVLPDNRRLLWTFVLFATGAFTMPVYWYFLVWKAPPPPASDYTFQLQTDTAVAHIRRLQPWIALLLALGSFFPTFFIGAFVAMSLDIRVRWALLAAMVVTSLVFLVGSRIGKVSPRTTERAEE